MSTEPFLRARDLFTSHYRDGPQLVASAPGRVNLIGEHTDYNGGEVLPIAIEERTWVAVSRAPSVAESIAISESGRRLCRIDPTQAERSGSWTDYVVGVIHELETLGCPVPAFHMAIASDVPTGAGLSSSAALEVAVAAALLELAGHTLTPTDIALAGNRAENDFVGVRSGIMDQFVSALAREGHALHLRCDTLATQHVPFSEQVLIFDTRVPRSLRGSAFNTRREECEAALRLLHLTSPDLPHLSAATPEQVESADLPEPLDRRARHVAEENRRVRAAVDSLRGGLPIPGDLLLGSHESLRDQYECSSPELDWFVNLAISVPGVRGARLTGAGWGGCAIAVGQSLDELASVAPEGYRSAFGIEPRIWITRASRGVALSDSTNPL